MSDFALELPLYDVTARKVHQWAMVALVVVAFLVEGVPAAVLLVLAGAVMLLGRFWWPADVFRQLTWRVLEPAGLPRRRSCGPRWGTPRTGGRRSWRSRPRAASRAAPRSGRRWRRWRSGRAAASGCCTWTPRPGRRWRARSAS